MRGAEHTFWGQSSFQGKKDNQPGRKYSLSHEIIEETDPGMSLLAKIQGNKEKRGAKLQAILNSLVKELGTLGALRIVLFGSFSRGEIDVGSDLDLLVIMPSGKTGKEWRDLIYGTVERTAGVDLIVFNEKEFHENLPRSAFLRNAIKGKMIYEKAV
jgi:predicted nucleotidyltransferase